MAKRTNVGGRTLEPGEQIDVADARQITSMLERKVAFPADNEASRLWHQSQAQQRVPWTWRGRK